jgi:proteic killer suppression protein
MQVLSARHKGLKRLIEDDDERGINPDLVRRVRRSLTALLSAQDIAGLQGPPGWRVHQLTGDRAGTLAYRSLATGGSPSMPTATP